MPRPFWTTAHASWVEKTYIDLVDRHPGETTSTVSDLNGNIVAQGGPYAETGTEYVEQSALTRITP